MGHDYMEKRLALMDLFQIMFGDLTEPQKAILDKAVDITYARKGINRDSYKAKKPPILQDLYMSLKSMETDCKKTEGSTYTALLNRLGMYSEKGVFSFLLDKRPVTTTTTAIRNIAVVNRVMWAFLFFSFKSFCFSILILS